MMSRIFGRFDWAAASDAGGVVSFAARSGSLLPRLLAGFPPEQPTVKKRQAEITARVDCERRDITIRLDYVVEKKPAEVRRQYIISQPD